MANFSRMVTRSHNVLVITEMDDKQDKWYIPDRTLGVFSPQLWITISVLFGLLVITHMTLTRDPSTQRNNRFAHLRMRLPSCWRWFAHYMQGNAYTPFEHSSMRAKLIMVITGLFTIHTLCLYQGYLLAQLVSDPPSVLPFHTITEVATMIKQKDAVLNLIDEGYSLPIYLRTLLFCLIEMLA